MSSEPLGFEQIESEPRPVSEAAATALAEAAVALQNAKGSALTAQSIFERRTLVGSGEVRILNSPSAEGRAGEDGTPLSTIDEDTILAASREVVWESVGRWAQEILGEPGAHLADIRGRLTSV